MGFLLATVLADSVSSLSFYPDPFFFGYSDVSLMQRFTSPHKFWQWDKPARQAFLHVDAP